MSTYKFFMGHKSDNNNQIIQEINHQVGIEKKKKQVNNEDNNKSNHRTFINNKKNNKVEPLPYLSNSSHSLFNNSHQNKSLQIEENKEVLKSIESVESLESLENIENIENIENEEILDVLEGEENLENNIIIKNFNEDNLSNKILYSPNITYRTLTEIGSDKPNTFKKKKRNTEPMKNEEIINEKSKYINLVEKSNRKEDPIRDTVSEYKHLKKKISKVDDDHLANLSRYKKNKISFKNDSTKEK